MTLRVRIVVIVALVALVALAAGVLLVYSQFSFSVSQVDQQLLSLEKQASKVVKYVDAGGTLASPSIPSRTEQKGSNDASVNSEDLTKAPVLPEAYVGFLSESRSLSTYIFENDSVEAPHLGKTDFPYEARSVLLTVSSGADGESSGLMRVALIPQGKSFLVIGVSMAPILAASIWLAGNAFLGWLVIVIALVLAYVWVSRLGLRPLRRVADVARRISAGDKSERVPTFPSATEAHALGVAVNDLLDQNQRVESNLRQFVSDAAHELRTPLTAIAGYSALFEKGLLKNSTDLADAMRRIHEESTRMTRLVNDLLTLTQAERTPAGNLAELVDIVPVVDAVLSDMRVIDATRTYSRSGLETLMIPVNVDRLTQLLLILLTNASDYSPEGSLVDVGLTTRERYRISITSFGNFIPPDQSERLFERFSRLDDSRQRISGRGTGLGLAIARAIVVSMGGQIRIESHESSGDLAKNVVWIELSPQRDVPS